MEIKFSSGYLKPSDWMTAPVRGTVEKEKRSKDRAL